MVQLGEQQKTFFRDNGYIVLKNAIPAEDLNRISEEFDKLFSRIQKNGVGACHNGISPQTIQGVQDLQLYHAVFNKYIFNETLLDTVENVLGTDNIVLHHTFGCKTIAKRAHPMHQDYHYFPHEKDTMIAALLHLDAPDDGQGLLFVYPGSHKLGPMEDVGSKQGNYHFVDQSRFPFEGATQVRAGRGDIVLLSYLVVHGSSPNLSDRPKRLLLAQMASADDRPMTIQPLKPCQGLMLRGTNLNRDTTVSKRFEKS